MKYICIKDFLQHLEKGQVYDVETTMVYGMRIYILCNGHVKLSDETLPEYLRPYLQVGDCFQQTWESTKPMWFMFCSQDNFELYEQKIDIEELKPLNEFGGKLVEQTWREEDEKMIRGLIAICDEWTTSHSFYPIENCDIEKLKNWLKSLKDRYTWKPSEEQLKSIQEVIDVGHFTSYPNALELCMNN